MSLSTIKKCTHRSCLFAPGQSWEGQGDHSCKQAGNKKRNVENLCRRINRAPDWSEICFFFNISRPFSHRKGQSPWPDAQQSLTPAQASAMFSSLAQVSVFLPHLSNNYPAVFDRFIKDLPSLPLSWWMSPQVQQVWSVQKHWGKRASPIASSCAPWTDILHMTGLNWVRFVHRP